MTNQVLAPDGVAMAGMALRNRRSSWRRYLAVFVLLAALMGCQSAEEAAEPIEVPLTSFDSSVELNVSVGFFNGRLLFTNQSAVDLNRILVVVNEGEQDTVEFRGSINQMKANTMLHFTPTIFKNAAGDKLNPKEDDVRSIAVYADSPDGRGRWYGSYRR